VREVRIRPHAVAVERLVQVAKDSNVPADVADEIGGDDELASDLTLGTNRELIEAGVHPAWIGGANQQPAQHDVRRIQVVGREPVPHDQNRRRRRCGRLVDVAQTGRIQ
jgi:hypothetical protein